MGLVLSFHHVVPEDPVQVVRLDRKHLYPLGYHASLKNTNLTLQPKALLLRLYLTLITSEKTLFPNIVTGEVRAST